jgi:hypothetical protein
MPHELLHQRHVRARIQHVPANVRRRSCGLKRAIPARSQSFLQIWYMA